MRRTDREITDINKIAQILKKCDVLTLSMSEGDVPYAVPMNFGYRLKDEKLELYLHAAIEGKKLNILKENKKVCVTMYCNTQLFHKDAPCSYGYLYQSLTAFGEAEVVYNIDDKKAYLSSIMQHYTDRDFTFTDTQVRGLSIIRLKVFNYTAKGRTVSN